MDTTGSDAETDTRHFSWRTFGSVALILFAALLLPLSVVAGWVKAVLVSEDAFVSALAPLAEQPEVQGAVSDAVTEAIESQVDIEGLVNTAIDGFEELGLPESAQESLDLLRGPAVEGANALIAETVSQVVASDTFSATWRAVLVSGHKAFVAVAAGGSGDGTVGIDDEGNVVIDLSPVVVQVKGELIAKGFTAAERIPEMSVTFVVAQSDALATIRSGYSAAVAVGWVLPLVALGFFIGGVLLARDRRKGAAGAGSAMVISSGVTLIALAVVGHYVRGQANTVGLDAGALGSVFDQVVLGMRETLVVVGVLGVLMLLVAWAAGPSAPAQALRERADAGNSAVARSLLRAGAHPGGAARWFARRRKWVHVALVVLLIAALIVLPKNVGFVVWTLAVTAVLWWLSELLVALSQGSAPPESVD